MCVIIGGLKKNLRRPEQLEGMKHNSYGFAISVIHKTPSGKNNVSTVRSIDESDVMKAWDAALPDDYVVTHSRIPSAGGRTKNLADVHGWTREGVTFFHNGTMSNIIGIMDKTDRRTDSLYFFEEIFIPIFKSQGRKFNKLVERVCQACADGSRMCFILPGGEVVYVGEFIDDHECKFSNRSYCVVAQTHYGYGSGWWNHGYRPLGVDDPDPDPDPEPDAGGASPGTAPAPASGGTETDTEEPTDGAKLISAVGLGSVARFMLRRYVLTNVRELMVDESAGSDIDEYKRLNEQFIEDDLSASDEAILNLKLWSDPNPSEQAIVEAVGEYAESLYNDIASYSSSIDPDDNDLRTAFNELSAHTVTDGRMVNTVFSNCPTSMYNFARSYKMTESTAQSSAYGLTAYMVIRPPAELFGISSDIKIETVLSNAAAVISVALGLPVGPQKK